MCVCACVCVCVCVCTRVYVRRPVKVDVSAGDTHFLACYCTTAGSTQTCTTFGLLRAGIAAVYRVRDFMFAEIPFKVKPCEIDVPLTDVKWAAKVGADELATIVPYRGTLYVYKKGSDLIPEYVTNVQLIDVSE
eukprot:GHVU01159868.1.p2 GENE.GHVU01159868.1~~GHVU01159868.1.p2  ORF type:complete len:134 (+),score=12.99 GHVU01159868.1:327-728(+)